MIRVPHASEMDCLQRDGMPYDDGPKRGACWNCDHMVEIRLGGNVYQLCVKERDISAAGDVTVVDDGIRDCDDWEDYDA